MKKTLNIVFFILLIISINSCKKEIDKWEATPEIEFISISPQSMQEYAQSIVITIKYKDGDGDLGQNNTDAPNTFVTDMRNGTLYTFRTQQLAPDNATIPITGQLNITIPTTWILSNANSESVSYTVYLKDRSGNQSNTITTSSVTLTK
jgi:hypothetical protein